MTQTECEVEGIFTIVAGAESTAVAIRSILLYTIGSPRVYSLLKAEINEAIKKGACSSIIGSEEVKSLPYLSVSLKFRLVF